MCTINRKDGNGCIRARSRATSRFTNPQEEDVKEQPWKVPAARFLLGDLRTELEAEGKATSQAAYQGQTATRVTLPTSLIPTPRSDTAANLLNFSPEP